MKKIDAVLTDKSSHTLPTIKSVEIDGMVINIENNLLFRRDVLVLTKLKKMCIANKAELENGRFYFIKIKFEHMCSNMRMTIRKETYYRLNDCKITWLENGTTTKGSFIYIIRKNNEEMELMIDNKLMEWFEIT
jgi:hypothetical protein